MNWPTWRDGQYKVERRKRIARLKQWIADTGVKFPVPED
jgi:hypothetical protein